MKKRESKGRLVIIGGADESPANALIFREFAALAGGRRAHVVILSAETKARHASTSAYKEMFREAGVHHVDVLNISCRADANNPETYAKLLRATGILFGEGDGQRIVTTVGRTKLDALLHEMYGKGLVLACTGRNAGSFSDIMILTHLSTGSGPPQVMSGLGFVGQILVEDHFDEPMRLKCLLSAVIPHPHGIGIGIDKNTAIVVSEDFAEVIGGGSVTILDASKMNFINCESSERTGTISVSGVILHLLIPGERFNIRNPTIITPEQTVTLAKH